MRDMQSIFINLQVDNNTCMTSLFPRSVVYLIKKCSCLSSNFSGRFFQAALLYRAHKTTKRVYITANYFLINRTSAAISAIKSPFGKSDNLALAKAYTQIALKKWSRHISVIINI